MRRSRSPRARRVIFTYPDATVTPNPADKMRRDLRAWEVEAERQAFNLAARLEHRRRHDPNACGVCGARISAPESVARGIGPVCADRARHAAQLEEAF